MNADLSELRKRTVSVTQYMNNLELSFRQNFLATEETYRLQSRTTNHLKEFARRYVIVAFSAGWCKDCSKIIPILNLIAKATGMEVMIFGGLKSDPLSHTAKWRVPPSPPEVKAFDVSKIPLVIVLDREGREIGRIVETPKRCPTLEEELWEIIKSSQ